ncbi:MAG: maltose alpha-D-glucosyltransferase [Chloroflexota bacterium]
MAAIEHDSASADRRVTGADPLWYKDAIIYELHVRAFQDSNGDGIGDFRGLTEKLDYLQDLGVTALWLLPFYPSPLKDDGYDIADYTTIHPSYGNLHDFKVFLREAHRRGLRVITELVINHTSVDHPWFQRARRAAPGSIERDFYVWSDSAETYRDARIIFKDFEPSNWAWDPVARSYYWHRFYSHQPDLNYDNPAVRKAIFKILDTWLGMGIDGLRLDAVPYLYEREGTSCENLPETHRFLRELRGHVDRRYPERMLLAEANQWPEDAVAYFGDGDESNMAFHFPIMPRMFMAIRMEDRYPIVDTLAQTPPIPETAQWALFLRNHDELTLEMVTDEERDYMYRAYAQDPEARINLGIRRRLAPLLGNHRRRIELMNGLLFSLPGTPVLYYGDEIGMGDNVYLGDRNGVRTPMQWSADRNAGFSRANPQQLYLPVVVDSEYHYQALNVEAQQKNPHSLLWWMKRLIALRKRFKALGRGSLEFLDPENRKILAFVRRYQDETILVVANLSRFVQYVELNLSQYSGATPIEVFGRTRFPRIGELPYLLTLGPHAFYWFTVEPDIAQSQALDGSSDRAELGTTPTPTLAVDDDWTDALVGPGKARLEALLASYFPTRAWGGQPARRIKGTRILDSLPLDRGAAAPRIVLVRIDYVEGDPETFAIPLALATAGGAERLRAESPRLIVADVRQGGKRGRVGALYDCTSDGDFLNDVIEAIGRRRQTTTPGGQLLASPTRSFRPLRGPTDDALGAQIARVGRSATAVAYADRLVLKLFRRLDGGVTPDLEVGRFLTERAGFLHTPPTAGFLEYRDGRGEPTTLAVLRGFVPNQGDAWHSTLGALGDFYERVATLRDDRTQPTRPDGTLLELSEGEPSAHVTETLGAYLEVARHLGELTAKLHRALASSTNDPHFAPESFSALYQRSLYQSMRTRLNETFQLLARRLPRLEGDVAEAGRALVGREGELLAIFQAVRSHKIEATRLRCHGDYRLEHLLCTGRDFAIVDFEGDPARTLGERRIKRSPLTDVAAMLRSFHDAAETALAHAAERGLTSPEDVPGLGRWADFWHTWVSATFLKAYLEGTSQASIVPRERTDLQILLGAFALERDLHALADALDRSGDRVARCLRAISRRIA